MTKLTCTLSIACESVPPTVDFFPGFAGRAPPRAESALTTAAQGWPRHISLPVCHMFIGVSKVQASHAWCSELPCKAIMHDGRL